MMVMRTMMMGLTMMPMPYALLCTQLGSCARQRRRCSHRTATNDLEGDGVDGHDDDDDADVCDDDDNSDDGDGDGVDGHDEDSDDDRDCDDYDRDDNDDGDGEGDGGDHGHCFHHSG